MSNIIFSLRYVAERQFRDTLFSRKLFSRIVILPNVLFSHRHFAECFVFASSLNRMQLFRIVIQPNTFSRKCIEWIGQLVKSLHFRIVKLPKVYNVEYHFLDSVFSRMSFSRHIIQPKDIFLDRHFSECFFLESSFSRMQFSRIIVQPKIFPKKH